MDTQQLEALKFLLKLQECNAHRSKLGGLTSFKQKADICQRLGLDGLVDFSREIAEVELAPAGRALLELDIKHLPIQAKELKVLQKIGKALGKITPSKIKISGVKAAERDTILNTFSERGYISVVRKLKRTNAEVWLTDRGKDCLSQVVKHFQQLRQTTFDQPVQPSPRSPDSRQNKPDIQQVLNHIQSLDRDLATKNLLPIFHLRQKLQPPLSKDELDQTLFQLEKMDQIELKSLMHANNYTSEQIQMGIQLNTGSVLFFIQMIG